VVGRVYNGLQKPPYDLPAQATQSGVRTRSTPAGGPSDGNEIRFEDGKDREELFMQAERTMTVRVKGSESHNVGGDRSTSVGGDQETRVQGDHDVEVSKGHYQIAVRQKHMAVNVPEAEFRVFGKYVWHRANQALLANVDDSSLFMDRTKVAVATVGEITCGVSGNVIRIDPTGVSVTAMERLTLTCGPSTIELTLTGIRISSAGPVDLKGLPIKLNS
jgi:type VI secretion system secreted protein VgrG